ncbi:ATP-grasp fold amidoligase family protein [Photobacterium damselae]|uniref:ATP-grasp fold amidoligase family protein n=1 Tax=Photobacterium damselae TaxID=38293 RepID=UPI0035A8504D
MKNLFKKYGILKKYVNKNKNILMKLLVNDEVYIKRKFKKTFGYDLNLEEPQTLNEKIQWLKLNINPSEYKVFADKLLVRDFVSDRVGDSVLIPIFNTYESANELNIDTLPDEPFIVKTNHDSSGGIIVRSKKNIDMENIKEFCKFNLSNNHYYISREKHYKDLDRKIIIEKLLLDQNGRIPNDYKINCFNGKAEFIYCAIDREGLNYRKIYDLDWNELNFKWGDEKDFDKKFNGPNIDAPENLLKMVEIAEKLSNGFPYLRIDLYNVDGKIYLGEITIYHGGGFDVISPKEKDIYYGGKIKIKDE